MYVTVYRTKQCFVTDAEARRALADLARVAQAAPDYVVIRNNSSSLTYGCSAPMKTPVFAWLPSISTLRADSYVGESAHRHYVALTIKVHWLAVLRTLILVALLLVGPIILLGGSENSARHSPGRTLLIAALMLLGESVVAGAFGMIAWLEFREARTLRGLFGHAVNRRSHE
jgi:hypothetical protein